MGTDPDLAHKETAGRDFGWFEYPTDPFLQSRPGPLAGYLDPLLTLGMVQGRNPSISIPYDIWLLFFFDIIALSWIILSTIMPVTGDYQTLYFFQQIAGGETTLV